MVLRKCIGCGLEAFSYSDLISFSKSKKHKFGHMNECKECTQKRKNPLRQERKTQYKRKAIILKGGQCECCGIVYNEKNSCIFDFHHLDPKEKEYTPSTAVGSTWDIYKKEIDKCILVCSNCHRLIHNTNVYKDIL